MAPEEGGDLHQGGLPAGALSGPFTVMTVRDVETLRALSDPLRLRILETMVQRLGPAWSVKELAAALGVPQTRLYHHIDLLAERGLVVPVERRIVSGIVETRYRAAASAFQLDRRLLFAPTEESQSALHQTLASVFDRSRDEIWAAVEQGAVDAADSAPPERRLLLSRGILRLPPARVAELRERLMALIAEFEADPAPAGASYGLVLALYPAPPAGEPGRSEEPSGD